MVRKGTRLLSGVNVQVTKIKQLLTQYPTLSDKDSEDLGPKIRYIADRSDESVTHLSNISSNTSTTASNTTTIVNLLEVIKEFVKTNSIDSFDINIDNSTGTSDVVQPISDTSLQVKHAVILNDVSSGTIYIGGSQNQKFPLTAGSAYKTFINDLSKVYVRVPAGVSATIHIIYES